MDATDLANHGRISNFSADVLWMLPVFCVLMVIGTMNHADFASEAREVRLELASRITDEICADATLSGSVRSHLSDLPGDPHRPGVDPPLSRLQNPDMPYLAAAQETLRGAAATSFAKRLMAQLVNITPDYTRGDRIVTWIVFGYSIVYKFLIAFVMAAVLGRALHWGAGEWSGYFFVVSVVVPAAVDLVTVVWFGIGTVRDLKRLFHDLETRVRDDTDNGLCRCDED